jgi:hypothetical protein
MVGIDSNADMLTAASSPAPEFQCTNAEGYWDPFGTMHLFSLNMRLVEANPSSGVGLESLLARKLSLLSLLATASDNNDSLAQVSWGRSSCTRAVASFPRPFMCWRLW